MNALQNKNIVLGVCGGIAAYKSPDLVRRLAEAGANVQVVMTGHAREFVSPLTFQAVSGRAARDTLFDEAAEAAMGHIELARWADLILIAPATANTIARITHGLADDLLTTLCLATRAPLAVAPAMNQVMWSNPATQANIALLSQRGVSVLGPGCGDQACGETGAGRMLEPLVLREQVAALLDDTAQSLAGKSVLITAGPTREAIDPVRYISNHSSGKMGFAIAAAAAKAGARVTLIAGPTTIAPPAGCQVVAVESAAQMHQAVMEQAAQHAVFISVAAVADFRLKEVREQKMKKSADEITLTLIKNPDILADVAALQNGRPFCVGFAAETHDLENYAADKLARKNLDMICANLVQSGGDSVFNSDDNALEIFLRDGGRISLPSASKTRIAHTLVDLIAERLG
ncbi:bifunctional phosphopantothenoylcysteine decarboxylase/phosphopantothenate--cysteine ligase CoaBC [Granulosicoccaceae sp. 1_MG-2023]|nr:bifunctional phosphopantothenoylcysteine decarboxylase/phosphopantothenate--cysteine ligase CoaBC [Granulosicoccaceae sp. 1_MG-2023]